MRKLTPKDFTLPLLLIALSIVPLVGGVVRLIGLSQPAPAPLEHARFVNSPVPIALHIVSATLFCILGAFQLAAGFRLRWPGWHRRAGRLLVLCGLVAGATGVWMTAFYAIPTGMQGPLLYVVRLIVGSAMIASIIVSWWSILRRDVPRHEAFMIRAYALGQGAGTQVLVLGPWMAITGESHGLTRDVLMTVAWAINLAIAELLIHSRTKAARRLRPQAVQQWTRATTARSHSTERGSDASLT